MSIGYAIVASKESNSEFKSGSAIDSNKGFITGHNSNGDYSYINAIKDAKKQDIDLSGATLYTTHEPHRRHALKIADAGIKKVVFLNYFGERGRDVLRVLGVDVEKASE